MNKGQSNPRYKTTLCKKYMSSKSCPYGEKCQFAHGEQELRSPSIQANNNLMYNMAMGNKGQNSYLNYKIIKCKNWEKDKTCKYGQHCTFVHGEEELRNKADNLYQMNPAYICMLPNMQPPNIDMAQMQQLMANNQYMMQMPMNINMNKGNEISLNENGGNKAE